MEGKNEMKTLFIAGSLSAFLAVALGAFAAHALKQKLSEEMFNIFEVGVRYHMYHALGLLIVGLAATRFSEANMAPVGWLFIAGTMLFSGSLYALSLSGMKWLGAITPFGGLCFLAGWLLLALKTWKSF